jgi:hypothetical protein
MRAGRAIVVLLISQLSAVAVEKVPAFHTDVLPVLTRAGCNAAACHGASSGQGGLRLSLFGYDPEADFERITREFGGRRIDLARPEESLLLRKPSETEVDHEGGLKLKDSSDGYALLRAWITAGAPAGPPDLHVAAIAVPGPPKPRNASTPRHGVDGDRVGSLGVAPGPLLLHLPLLPDPQDHPGGGAGGAKAFAQGVLGTAAELFPVQLKAGGLTALTKHAHGLLASEVIDPPAFLAGALHGEGLRREDFGGRKLKFDGQGGRVEVPDYLLQVDAYEGPVVARISNVAGNQPKVCFRVSQLVMGASASVTASCAISRGLWTTPLPVMGAVEV